MCKVTEFLNKDLKVAENIEELHTDLPLEWFVCKFFHECYDILRILRMELVKRGAEVSESHATDHYYQNV